MTVLRLRCITSKHRDIIDLAFVVALNLHLVNLLTFQFANLGRMACGIELVELLKVLSDLLLGLWHRGPAAAFRGVVARLVLGSSQLAFLSQLLRQFFFLPDVVDLLPVALVVLLDGMQPF